MTKFTLEEAAIALKVRLIAHHFDGNVGWEPHLRQLVVWVHDEADVWKEKHVDNYAGYPVRWVYNKPFPDKLVGDNIHPDFQAEFDKRKQAYIDRNKLKANT